MTTVTLGLFAPEVQVEYQVGRITVDRLGGMFQDIAALWVACLDIEYAEFHAWEPNSVIVPRLRAEVQTLSINSPLWMELLFPGAGVGAGATAVHLLVHCMRKPESVASWLPGFVAAWHRRWAEADRARLEHAKAHQATLDGLAEIARQRAAALPVPSDLRVLNLDEPPPELRENALG